MALFSLSDPVAEELRRWNPSGFGMIILLPERWHALTNAERHCSRLCELLVPVAHWAMYVMAYEAPWRNEVRKKSSLLVPKSSDESPLRREVMCSCTRGVS